MRPPRSEADGRPGGEARREPPRPSGSRPGLPRAAPIVPFRAGPAQPAAGGSPRTPVPERDKPGAFGPRPLPPTRPDDPPRPLWQALLITAAATVAPGSGHLLLRRWRTGAAILAVFLLGVVGFVVLATAVPRSELLERLLSTDVLLIAAGALVVIAVAWMAVVVWTYLLARPPGLPRAQQLIGAGTVALLCLGIAAPFGFAANLANSQVSLLEALFPSAGDSAAAAFKKPRLNILLIGSDAGPDREGTRTDTMMVANIDTRTGRTILFGLPRNIGHAQFPPGSPADDEFPSGFHGSDEGEYLLNAVYGYGHAHPEIAPSGPTADPGLNLLQSSISYMLGLPIDYYLEIDMAGFAAIVDALGGLTVDVGPERIPIGGISSSGRLVRPDGYIEPGVQHLSGAQALAFARSRTGTTDYVRMGRQRCLIQYVLDQKSPTDLLTNFQAVARATTSSVSTNIPREMLPALVSLAGDHELSIESVSFDPNLPDPEESDGRFNTGRPNFPYMREVVSEALDRDPAEPTPTPSRTPSSGSEDSDDGDVGRPTSAAPTPLTQAC